MKTVVLLLSLAAAISALPAASDDNYCATWLYQDADKGNNGAQVQSGTFSIPAGGESTCFHGFYDAANIPQQTTAIEKFGACTCFFFKSGDCTGDDPYTMDQEYVANVGDEWNDQIQSYKCKAT